MPALRWKQFGESWGQMAALAALVGGCLVVSWEVWPRIDRWHQRRFAEQLADRIATLPDDQVKVPLHQLARLGTPALASLVEAAASERDAVARIAQQEIDLAFSASLVQLREAVDESPAEAMIALAAALAENVERFGPAGKRWAESMALRMIEVSDRLPVGPATSLLGEASRVLEGVPPRGPRQRNVESVVAPPPLAHSAAVAPPALDVQMLAAPSEQVLSAVGQREPLARPQASAPIEAPSEGELPAAPAGDWNAEWIGVKSYPIANSLRAPTLPLAGDNSLSVKVLKRQPSVVVEVPTPLDFERRLVELRRMSTEELMGLFAEADKFGAGAIRTVLTERGLNATEVEMVAQIKSADEAGRMRLIDEVSRLPAAEARRLLRLLLSDPSGEVRLRALTALATANDPSLAKLARTIAVEDKDPRVAELASKLLRQ